MPFVWKLNFDTQNSIELRSYKWSCTLLKNSPCYHPDLLRLPELSFPTGHPSQAVGEKTGFAGSNMEIEAWDKVTR